MSRKPRLLFLYTELAGYFIACLRKLNELYPVDMLVIHWDINKEAPFKFSFPENIRFNAKSSFTFNELVSKVEEFNPDFIYSSGWADKDYLKVISKFKKGIPCVIVLDNPWQYKIKQYLACIISRFTILRIFTHCWVSGEKQKKYARKLGFKKERVMMGMYSADVDYYMKLGLKYQQDKRNRFPKKFIYVGRYTYLKGVTDLWTAFKEWKKESGSEWELWCLGTGELKPDEFQGVTHFGFIQPGNIEKFIKETGVFILPSHFEPWGVALHEFVAAGFPVICSGNVSASEKFVEDMKNGYMFPSGNVKKLKECINAISKKSSEELNSMSEISRELSIAITPETWSATIMNLILNK